MKDKNISNASLHEGKKVQCDFCPKSFTKEGNFNNLIVIDHECKIPFQCSILDTKVTFQSLVSKIPHWKGILDS